MSSGSGSMHVTPPPATHTPGSAGPSTAASNQRHLLRVKGFGWPGQQMSLSVTNVGRGPLLTLENTGHVGRESAIAWEPGALGSNFSLLLASCVPSSLWALGPSHVRADSGVRSPTGPSGLLASLLRPRGPKEEPSLWKGFVEQAAAPKECLPGSPALRPRGSPESRGAGG